MSEGINEESKTLTLAQIQRPFLMDGNVVVFVKKWKKRYVVWKDDKLFFFEKNYGKEVPKEVFIMSSDTTMTTEIEQKEKKSIVRFKGVSGEIMILADESISFIEMAFKLFKSNLGCEKKKEEIEKLKVTQKEPEENKIPPWEEIKNKINIKSKINGKELQSLFKELGKTVTEYYFYSIVKEIINQWNDDEIIEFGYQQFCEEDLEDFGSLFGGRDNSSTEIQFVLGTNEENILRLLEIYMKIYKQFKLEWSELTKCLLVSMACWELFSNTELFNFIIVYLSKQFDIYQLLTFLHLYCEFESDLKLPLWHLFPSHIELLFKSICSSWTLEQKNLLISIIDDTWEWTKQQIDTLKSLLIPS
ncbi:hypothetical protein EHI8A_061090 [Entamoeba histolytica HM-1:IMSS-B]|uniref:PH domain-containing protein n=4 Tax=Entamoeba histolytica TaxID=5759 RepID=C4M3K1_ENTH1|nr:hypothetical protein EHI_109820 [Entamoeba histolytica HM-1:IMSS]EAL46826.2 hypothetical protein EHI_109820 [Entamoeba histolytica HM-1:IMSS]EMH75854.1 hypothetical protein EHI8A_061090 [Entamoeba histolytica HM-1:IMSS-B]ENY62916.1 hypothetical protein EHI7A_058880 [Entamoeba histolytica HM-1:IMSS-A]GAT95900.1 hypothetical protein CL6EHI_109820 [Entamoeba histolytica]|eukprot:XP_652214.2 hypothetical protein EHI_109820 [Entamoeba histolytica HM-1:IMSS]